MTTHTYAATLTWSGSTGQGYDKYDRAHRMAPEGAPELTVSADPAFRGDPALLNPEQLLLAAASSCQLLSFLAIAARARLDVVDYVDRATAVMPEDQPPTRITEIVLRPHITLRGPGSAKIQRLVDLAHKECFIANSISAPIRIEPSVDVVD